MDLHVAWDLALTSLTLETPQQMDSTEIQA